MKDLEIEYVDIDALVPMPGNPRLNAAAVPKVANSIKRFGWTQPILARREDRVVVAGHTRLEAAKRLKLNKVPVIWTDLGQTDSRLYNLADNKLAEVAEWDNDALAVMLKELKAEDQDGLDLAGFGADELDKLLADATLPADDEGQGGDRNFNITYTLVFNTLAEQAEWFKFVGRLKQEMPQLGTVSERLIAYLREKG